MRSTAPRGYHPPSPGASAPTPIKWVSMRSVKTPACVLALVLGSALPAAGQTVADSGTFIVRHSGDTVATETFSRQETAIQGTLSLNNSNHTFHRYTAVLAPDASVPMIDVSVREDADSGRVKAKLVKVGDLWKIDEFGS